MSRLRSAGQAVRYASRTTGVNFEKILTWGAIGAGLYIALTVLGVLKKGTEAAGKAYDAAVSTTSDVLYTLFGPKEIADSAYRTVTFPNGLKHSIPMNAVNPTSGIFVNSWPTPFPGPYAYAGDGMRYRLVKDKSGVARAVLVT